MPHLGLRAYSKKRKKMAFLIIKIIYVHCFKKSDIARKFYHSDCFHLIFL